MANESKETASGPTAGKEWRKAGLGELPQFCYLSVDDTFEGTIADARLIVKEEKDKKGKVKQTKRQMVLHCKSAVSQAVGHGPKDQGLRRDLREGEMVAFDLGGNAPSIFKDIIHAKTGVTFESDQDLEAEDLKALAGVEIRIKRIQDQKMKKGPFAGKAVKRYDVDFAI